MSFHNNAQYQIPALVAALQAHHLEHDRPSQAADFFLMAAREAGDAEIERLKDALTFVERWANHHAQKPHVTAAEALSCIQHYPEIEAITESYADGKVPETRDPYAEITALKAERDALKQDAERLDWLDQNIFSRENINFMGQLDPTMNMWVTFSPKGHQGSARNILDAAMQAQEVKS